MYIMSDFNCASMQFGSGLKLVLLLSVWFPCCRKLQHKNLVRLLGVILHKGLQIVTELMTKVSLTNTIKPQKLFIPPVD